MRGWVRSADNRGDGGDVGGDDEGDGWQRPGPTAREQRRDVVIGLAFVAATLGSLLLAQSVGVAIGEQRPELAESVAWCVALTLPLTLRRRYPLTTLLAVSAVFIGMQARLVPELQMSSIALFTALFTAGAWGQDRRLTQVVRTGVVLVMFAWLAYSLSATAWGEAMYDDLADGPIPPATASMIYVTALNVLYFGAAVTFGTMAWNQARQRFLLDRRNAELAAARDRTARQAVVAERMRIARELHDVVAHHVSVMGVQTAGARRVLATDPDLARSTLEAVEESGRAAVAEMHRLLGVLREDDADGGSPAPAADLSRLPELVERVGAAGPRAELTVVGTPAPMPPSVSVSAYRVVQEALTNALRHSGASRVDVRLRHLGGAIEVEIVDDGAGAGGTHRTLSGGTGPGMGLVGMRERVAVHGGEFEAGPRQTGGFRVRARFPVGDR